ANTTDMNVALALQSDKTYVDTQLALKSNQSTTYTKTEVDTELANKVNQNRLGSKLLHKVANIYQIGYQAKPDNHFIHPNMIDSSSSNQCEYSYNKNYKYRVLRCGLFWGYSIIHQVRNDLFLCQWLQQSASNISHTQT
ncbi:MAG: hypothetical protein ACKPKO_02865, partial [Candidatus Fonsibacter sp.]